MDICGHGFRAMACSALVEFGLWSETAIERQMSHKERNNVRAYTHKAEFLEERRMIMTWWSRFLGANREDHVTPHEFAKQTGENVTSKTLNPQPSRTIMRDAKISCYLKVAAIYKTIALEIFRLTTTYKS